MKRHYISRHVNICLVLATLLAFNAPLLRAQDAQRPVHNWGLAFTRYSQFRADYDSIPLRVVSVRGGKLSAKEKFKIEVSTLANRSDKPITHVEFTWYLFDNTDLDQLFDSGKSSLVELTLGPNEQKDCQIFVLNIEDIPFLKDNPKGKFTLEVGVTKIVYSDGTTWEGAAAPGKFVYEKQVVPEAR